MMRPFEPDDPEADPEEPEGGEEPSCGSDLLLGVTTLLDIGDLKIP